MVATMVAMLSGPSLDSVPWQKFAYHLAPEWNRLSSLPMADWWQVLGEGAWGCSPHTSLDLILPFC